MEQNQNRIPPAERAQNISLEGRHRLKISGVEDVENYDENLITVNTLLGTLSVEGDQLKILNLSMESGELAVEGNISALIYTDIPKATGGFFGRFFR